MSGPRSHCSGPAAVQYQCYQNVMLEPRAIGDHAMANDGGKYIDLQLTIYMICQHI